MLIEGWKWNGRRMRLCELVGMKCSLVQRD